MIRLELAAQSYDDVRHVCACNVPVERVTSLQLRVRRDHALDFMKGVLCDDKLLNLALEYFEPSKPFIESRVHGFSEA
jgi:hypothetical protein